MKKTLLFCIVFTLPFLGLAQNTPPVLDGFYKGIDDVQNAKISDDLSALEVRLDNKNFDVVAVDPQMKIL